MMSSLNVMLNLLIQRINYEIATITWKFIHCNKAGFSSFASKKRTLRRK